MNLDENTTYCMWTDTPVKSMFTYSREADTSLKIAGIADKMIHKHDGHAMISMINVLSSKTYLLEGKIAYRMAILGVNRDPILMKQGHRFG